MSTRRRRLALVRSLLRATGRCGSENSTVIGSARLDSKGILREFAMPSVGGEPRLLCADHAGTVTVLEFLGQKGFRLDTAGVQGVIAGPTFPWQDVGDSFVARSDGAHWLAATEHGELRRISPSGIVTAVRLLSASSGPMGLAIDRAGNVWFSEFARKKLGRLRPDGRVEEFDIVSRGSPVDISIGMDDLIWYGEIPDNSHAYHDALVGWLAPLLRRSADYSLPGVATVGGMTVGPSGDLWFTDTYGSRIGRIAKRGTLTTFGLPSRGRSPGGIAYARGSIWFTEGDAGKIGRLTPSVTP